METKTIYRVTTKTFPFEGFLHDFPTRVLVDATLEAQHSAIVALDGLEGIAARVELFWVVYNFEFRQYIERWLKTSADIEKRPDKA